MPKKHSDNPNYHHHFCMDCRRYRGCYNSRCKRRRNVMLFWRCRKHRRRYPGLVKLLQ